MACLIGPFEVDSLAAFGSSDVPGKTQFGRRARLRQRLWSTYPDQAIVASSIEAETTSRTLSPSRSAVATEVATSAAVEMTDWASYWPAPRFGYQAILSHT
jgi:hypothetical protein